MFRFSASSQTDAVGTHQSIFSPSCQLQVKEAPVTWSWQRPRHTWHTVNIERQDNTHTSRRFLFLCGRRLLIISYSLCALLEGRRWARWTKLLLLSVEGGLSTFFPAECAAISFIFQEAPTKQIGLCCESAPGVSDSFYEILRFFFLIKKIKIWHIWLVETGGASIG